MSTASTRDPGLFQHVGWHPSVAPCSIADTTIFSEPLGDLHERNFQTLEVRRTSRAQLAELRLKISHFLGGHQLVDPGRILGALARAGEALLQSRLRHFA